MKRCCRHQEPVKKIKHVKIGCLKFLRGRGKAGKVEARLDKFFKISA